LVTWVEFKKKVYEKIEVSSFRSGSRTFKVLGMKFILGKSAFSVSNRLISEVKLRSVDLENGSEVKMLRGLSSTNFEGVFTVSYEPFNYEVRFSVASKSLSDLSLMLSSLKVSMLAGYPRAELETLKASPEVVLWPIGGFPITTYKNTLIVARGLSFSAVSFLAMKLNDNSLNFLEDGLEDALRASAEFGCSLRFFVPFKTLRGLLHALSFWIKKESISLRYSKVYKELRKDGIFNNKGKLIGSDLKESSKLELLRLQYERINEQPLCWACSPIVIVRGPSAESHSKAYVKQRNYVEAVKASFLSSYGVKLEEIGRLSLSGVARSILARKTTNSCELQLTSEELSLFVNIPKLATPSISFMPRKVVEFEAFNPLDLEREGMLLGYYESLGKRIEVKIGINDLPLHLAIFGVPGSGKTTLVKKLIREYRRLGGAVMVFDRHGEYVNGFDDAVVLNPENVRVNIINYEENPETHAKILSEIFAMTWPDEFGPLVSHIFRRMYLKYVREANRPNLVEFITFLESSLNSEDLMLLRSGKARDKLFSLLGRLSELTEGAMGRIFNNFNEHETRIEELLSKMVVFNLTGLDTDRDANIFTWLILKQIYDYRRKKHNRSLPHAIVCEEAHNVAPARFEGQGTIVEKMLKEMRKFGESIWLIDQRPLAVSRDVLGLCGTIVCLRLQYSSDVKKVAETMHLNKDQALTLQELKQGEAVVLLPRLSTAIPINV